MDCHHSIRKSRQNLYHSCDSKGNLDPRRVHDVLELDEDALSGLGAEVDLVLRSCRSAHEAEEHQIELARLRELSRFACERGRYFLRMSSQVKLDVGDHGHVLLSSPLYPHVESAAVVGWSDQLRG